MVLCTFGAAQGLAGPKALKKNLQLQAPKRPLALRLVQRLLRMHEGCDEAEDASGSEVLFCSRILGCPEDPEDPITIHFHPLALAFDPLAQQTT